MRFFDVFIHCIELCSLYNYRSQLTGKIAIIIKHLKRVLSGTICLSWAAVETWQYNMAGSMEEDPLHMYILRAHSRFMGLYINKIIIFFNTHFCQVCSTRCQ